MERWTFGAGLKELTLPEIGFGATTRVLKTRGGEKNMNVLSKHYFTLSSVRQAHVVVLQICKDVARRKVMTVGKLQGRRKQTPIWKGWLTVLGAIVALALLEHTAVDAAWVGTTGILEGKVRDKQTHESLVGVNILVVGTTCGAATDTEGYFRIGNLRAGVYDVRFSMVGFKTLIMKEVTILPDLRTRLDVDLEPSAVELGVVESHAQRPLIQTDLPATAYSIGDVKLEKLPVSTFQEVLTLQPGTTLDGNVRGGKTNEVIYLVDGLPVQDVIGGGLGTNLPRSSITGLTMYTGGFEAEYGNALSGMVNVITKGGGDKHTFSARLEEDSWLPTSLNKQQDRAVQLEFSAGGPVVENQLQYFTANSVIASDTRWWQDFQYFPSLSPVLREFTGFGKIEYLFSPTLKVGLQGIYSLRDWHDYEFSWRFNLAGLPPRSRDSYRIAAILSHTLSQNSFYTISLSRFFLRSRIGEGPPDEFALEPYEYDFFLRYIVGGKRNWWADTRQVIYTLKGDFTTQVAKMHIIKFGVELNQYDIGSELIKYEPQTTYFGKPLLDAPLLNYSNSYKYYPRSGSVYLQDKIELEVAQQGYNMSVGIRWDFLDPTAERPIVEYIPVNPNEFKQQVTGKTKATFKHQLSPRVAFAAPVSTTSFFFVNFGFYFQFPLFDYLYSGITPAQLRAGTKNVLTGNPDLEPERTIAWEIGYKHSLTDNFVFSATYFQKGIKNQIDSKTLVPFDSKAAGDYGFAQYVNNAEANVSGLELVLSREQDERLSGSISYTYMVAEGVSEYVNQEINYAQWGFPLAAKPFPLSWDQRHTIKADAEFKLFWGIQTDLVVLYNSPRPYTYYPTRDGFKPVDTTKVFVPNNARMEDVIFVNAKLTRRFEFGEANRYVVTLYADVRNLLNTKNVKWVDFERTGWWRTLGPKCLLRPS